MMREYTTQRTGRLPTPFIQSFLYLCPWALGITCPSSKTSPSNQRIQKILLGSQMSLRRWKSYESLQVRKRKEMNAIHKLFFHLGVRVILLFTLSSGSDIQHNIIKIETAGRMNRRSQSRLLVHGQGNLLETVDIHATLSVRKINRCTGL